jgi:nucleoside-diphosphate-sugar epimerase
MASKKPALLVTGVSGSLGRRLLPLLQHFHVIGLDISPPPEIETSLEFEKIDLGQESSCGRMAGMLRETHAVGVVHLAFVLDPLRTGILDRDRMWRINVAGTARVLEAIAEANRMGANVEKLKKRSWRCRLACRLLEGATFTSCVLIFLPEPQSTIT